MQIYNAASWASSRCAHRAQLAQSSLNEFCAKTFVIARIVDVKRLDISHNSRNFPWGNTLDETKTTYLPLVA